MSPLEKAEINSEQESYGKLYYMKLKPKMTPFLLV